MRKRALWSSLIKKYGKKGLEVNVKLTAIQWFIWASILLTFFSMVLGEATIEKSPLALVIYSGILGLLFFILQAIYYGRYPTGTKFIIVYEDQMIISTHSDADGPGFVTVSRKEYWVDVIARDMEVRDPEKHKIYTIVFNKPIRGCMHVRLLPDMYVSEEELRKLIKILKPKKVLLDGYYFPRTYAVFKMVCGKEYHDLAEQLLKDFRNEVEKYGLYKVCAVMNALKSLCLAKRINDTIFLAKAIVDGRVFKFVDLINEKDYLKWFYDSTFLESPSYAYDFFYKLCELCAIGLILTPGLFMGSLVILPVIGLEALYDELFLLCIALVPLIAYGAGIGIFSGYPVYWSRVSIKCGMKCEVVYMILAVLIPWFLSLSSFLFAFEAMKYFWIFIIVSILFLPPSIIMMLVMCGYPQYKVGLKHAEILLNALRK